jgi:hypothetical protein
LPQNGTIKLYRELKCPLDDFELLVNSINKNRIQPFCPYCYNNPPFSEMKKGDFIKSAFYLFLLFDPVDLDLPI